jgi:hypothetical protein
MSSHLDSFVASGTSPTPDFHVENHGSVFLLYPLTQRAYSWIKEYLPENAQHFCTAVVVEHRYIWNILVAVQDDGLVVSRG